MYLYVDPKKIDHLELNRDRLMTSGNYLFHGTHEKEAWGDGDDIAQRVEDGEGGEVQRVEGEHDNPEERDAEAKNKADAKTLQGKCSVHMYTHTPAICSGIRAPIQ